MCHQSRSLQKRDFPSVLSFLLTIEHLQTLSLNVEAETAETELKVELIHIF